MALVLLHRPGLTGLPRPFPFGHGVIYSSVWVGSFDFCGFGLIRGFHCRLSVGGILIVASCALCFSTRLLNQLSCQSQIAS